MRAFRGVRYLSGALIVVSVVSGSGVCPLKAQPPTNTTAEKKSPFADLIFADSALLGAIARGDIITVKDLLTKDKTLLTQQHRSGYSPLGVAARTGNKEMVQLLLDNGADLTIASRGSYAPFSMAIQAGSKEIAQMFLDKGLDIKMVGTSALNSAITTNNKEMLDFLLAKGVDIEGNGGSSPLLNAVQVRNLEMVAYLLEKGANPNGKDGSRYGYSSPLYYAVQNDNKEIVKLLVDKGADPLATTRGEGQSALQYALANKKEMVELLLTPKVDLNAKDRRGQTLLHNAMSPGSSYSADTVRLLLDKGAEPNARNQNGFTPLHLAAQNGNSGVISTLVAHKADIKATTRMGDTALHLASSSNQPAAGLALLEAGADPNFRNGRGDLPLHISLRGQSNVPGRDSESLQNFRLALVNKTDINAKDQYGFTPLQLALLNRQFSMRDAILAQKPKLDSTTAVFDAAARNDATELQKLLTDKPYLTFMRLANGITPLHVAAQWGAKDTTDLLLKKYAEINARDAEAITPLLRVVRQETGPTNSDARAMATFLIDKGADATAVDENDNNTLHFAVQRGDKDMVGLLLGKGVDPNVRNKTSQTPLELLLGSTAENYDGSSPVYSLTRRTPLRTNIDKTAVKEIASLLLDKGADIGLTDATGNTLLMRAASTRNSDLVSLLLAKGADVNAKNNNGDTALTYLANYGGYSSSNNTAMVDVMKLLLDKGADVNVKNQNGESVLMRFLSNSNVELAKLLIEKGADLNAAREGGESGFNRLLAMGNKDLIKLAIEKKFDLNARDANGYTPLMRAISFGSPNKEVVQLLLDNGADVNATLTSGHTVLDVAMRGNRNNDIVDMLKAKGAKESGLKTPIPPRNSYYGGGAEF